MVDKELIAYFKLAHGFFNMCMMALFCYQGWMGFLIRQARTSGMPMPLDVVRRHRKAGPVFALWGIMGYFAGVVMIVLDKGRVFEYPLHFLAGSSIVLCIGGAFLLSRKITIPDSPFRAPHFALGLCLLLLYIIQMLLGLGILL